jgi:tRNA-splicing ligase RtcB
MYEQINSKLMSWASILEEKTREQAIQTSTMDFIEPHMALMPDAHFGKGATVGSVIPTLGAIMPAAVGVDIGCGMIAVRTQFTHAQVLHAAEQDQPLSYLRNSIERAIPLSAGKYNDHMPQPGESAYERIEELRAMQTENVMDESVFRDRPWELQLGSLGSGNHFIEVTVDENSDVWLFLHSGSRGIGNRLAQRHIRRAQEACAGRALPNPDLAYLTEGTEWFDEYIADLLWAQRFALLNRAEMMDRVVSCFENYMQDDVVRLEEINCHHNYTERRAVPEHWGIPDILLSRKGAIDASVGVRGLIPGSMGTASYVVTGLGNELALWSAPHGAGRVYSRTAARKQFDIEHLNEAMRGIEWSGSDAFLDEHPLAYKDVDIVIHDARELVDVDHELHQILNVKGA